MLSRLRRQLSYSNVVATLALFVALGGSGYAAATRSGGSEGLSARGAQTSSSGGGTAFGRVGPRGLLTRSSNVVKPVTHPRTGVYCIRLAAAIDPDRVGLVVTPDWTFDTSRFGAGGNHAIAEWRGDGFDCPKGRLEVRTGRQLADGSLEPRDQGFFFSTGAATQPRATAVVFADGRLDAGLTRGFTKVRKLSTGVFCLTHEPGIDPRKDPAVVNVVFNLLTAFAQSQLLAMWAAPTITCTADEYEVRTLDFKSGTAVLSDNVTFSIVVP